MEMLFWYWFWPFLIVWLTSYFYSLFTSLSKNCSWDETLSSHFSGLLATCCSRTLEVCCFSRWVFLTDTLYDQTKMILPHITKKCQIHSNFCKYILISIFKVEDHLCFHFWLYRLIKIYIFSSHKAAEVDKNS